MESQPICCLFLSRLKRMILGFLGFHHRRDSFHFLSISTSYLQRLIRFFFLSFCGLCDDVNRRPTPTMPMLLRPLLRLVVLLSTCWISLAVDPVGSCFYSIS